MMIPTEYQECLAYWHWAQTVPKLREYLYKIVNEGKRSPIQGRQLKSIGLRKGLPDYHYPVSNETYNGFWLEMKKRNIKEKSISIDQKEWMEKLRTVNQYATFAFGWEDAASKTFDYLNNRL